MPKSLLRSLSLCLLLLTSVVVAGCGSTPAAVREGPAVAVVSRPPAGATRNTPALQALPTSPFRLPAPGQLLEQHGASFTLADGYSDGADFDAALPNNRVSAAGNSGVFAPAYSSGEPLSELAYTVYAFTLPDYNNDAPVDIQLNWSDAPATGTCFVSLSEFFDGYWETYAVPADNRLPFFGFTEYISPSDIHLLAVFVTGSEAAILDSIQLSVQQAPVAGITPSVDSGIAPLSVTFDGSASMDPDGTVVNFEWDLDGDGLFNETGDEADSIGIDAASFTYASPGSYDATLRITDDADLQDEATVQINVSASQPPVADLLADPTSGAKLLEVDLNATNSIDPDGTVTDYEWDFDGDTNFNEGDNGEDTAHGSPLAQASYASVGDFNATVRVTDNDGGKDTASVLITVTNTPPTADIQADLTEGDAPFQVDFNAEGSFDPAGSIVEIEWDFDGDGLFNEVGTQEETAHNSSQPDPVDYPDPGVFNATVRVTDEDGASDTASLSITAHGWAFTMLDTATAGGGYECSLLVINGKPVIAHATVPYTVRYGVCSTELGLSAADWNFFQVDSVNAPGRSLSLKLINGNPAMAYFNDSGSNGYSYTRATTSTGASAGDWPVAVSLDSAGDGLDVSLLQVGGSPAVAHYDSTNGDLKYSFSSDMTGMTPANWSEITIEGDATHNYGAYPSLALIGGKPAVAYRMTNNTTGEGTVRFAYSSTAGGTMPGDWTKVPVASVGNGNYAQHMSLQDINGNPAIAYSVLFGGELGYVRASNAVGSAWNAKVSIEPPGAVAYEYSSLALVDGNPAVVYTSGNDNDPVFVRSTTSTGNAVGDWANKDQLRQGGEAEGRFGDLIVLPGGNAAAVWRNEPQNAVLYGVRF